MRITPLHLALGERDLPFGRELLMRAVEERVQERTDLDWKQALPFDSAGKPTHESAAQELAKDIAAMANTDGGLIVFGVKEDRGTSGAASLEGVGEVGDATQRALRQVAWSMVHPPVQGLELETVQIDEGVAFAAHIPRSHERPHLVHPKGSSEWFGVPWRDGSRTEWMSGRQMDAAYREKFDGEARRRRDFDARCGYFAKTCPAGPLDVWVRAIAAPSSSFPRGMLSIEREDILSLLEQAWHLRGDAWPGVRSRLMPPTPRPGLRRSVLRNNFDLRQAGHTWATEKSRAEIHDDGTVAVGFSSGGVVPGSSDFAAEQSLLSTSIEQVVLDVTALMRAVAKRTGTDEYIVRLEVELPVSGATVLAPENGMSLYRPLDDLDSFEPVETSLRTLAPREDYRQQVEIFLVDSVGQLGCYPTQQSLAGIGIFGDDQ